ncbi:hypothetical protein ACSRUE_21345 [Sorangium sp. KYC3313]
MATTPAFLGVNPAEVPSGPRRACACSRSRRISAARSWPPSPPRSVSAP